MTSVDGQWDRRATTPTITDHHHHHHQQLTKAAVLVALFEDPNDDGRVHVLLTQRSRKLRKHAGEVCFPGGKLDEADGGDVVVAALREAEEEIGLDPSEVEVGVALMNRASEGHSGLACDVDSQLHPCCHDRWSAA